VTRYTLRRAPSGVTTVGVPRLFVKASLTSRSDFRVLLDRDLVAVEDASGAVPGRLHGVVRRGTRVNEVGRLGRATLGALALDHRHELGRVLGVPGI
jgi:hypothetical protein